MARDEAYRRAEKKIDEALRSGAKKLDLGGALGEKPTKLTEVPESLAQLTHLHHVDLSRNKLKALPESLSHLRQLQSLNLFQNQLTALPEWLCRFTQLQSLNLSQNQLTTLPEWLYGFTQLQSLNFADNQLTALPESLGQLTQLQELQVGGNRIKALPEFLGQLTQLKSLDLSSNKLTALHDSMRNLVQVRSLSLGGNQLRELPDWIGGFQQLVEFWVGHMEMDGTEGGNPLDSFPTCIRRLKNLKKLWILYCGLKSLPAWLGELNKLELLNVIGNSLEDLPDSIGRLSNLDVLLLSENPLNPELAAAGKEGLEAVKRYLCAKAQAQEILNEAKLILIGEGEVGKSCLLGALRGDPWEEGRPTTHGIEIKPVQVTDRATGTEVTLNGWDFGGQRVYRPTHQLFFSAPAVYLVVWKPREGSQQGFVKEWIKLVKHREPEAKILVVATHGGPNERQPDIDRQEIWDLFGKETVIDFFHIDSRPPNEDKRTGKRSGECKGIKELKDAIARVAAGLPEMGASVPRQWHRARKALTMSAEAYLPLNRVFDICSKEHGIQEQDARILLRICRRVGDLIHYEHDPALHDIVVLKPDWLATAMSFVLDDKRTRDAHGLVSFARLGELWNDPARAKEFHYEPALHPLFLRLMERFDLSYKVALPTDTGDSIGFWERMSTLFGRRRSSYVDMPEIRYTSLIAQLVPDVRPDQELNRVWPAAPGAGEEQQTQICRIVEARNGQSASAEGLFYQLIVRLHRFSLGREDFSLSIHWQRGLVLDDEYNGRALLEHVGNDVRLTVRAAYPERFLSVLTREVEWLVENFWEGLRCDVMVPCIEPCGRKAPGTGLFEVEKLIDSKKRKRPDYPCPVCNEWQNIDCLLRNAPAARNDPISELLASFSSVKDEVKAIRPLLLAHQGEVMRRFDTNEARILSKVDDAYTKLMRALTDEAKEGPRLFSLEPVERSAFNPNGWMKKKFRVTLWCEHTRVPLPLLNKNDKEGVYELDVTRDWFVQAAPFLKAFIGTLSLVLPVAASMPKLAVDESAYKAFGDGLEFGKECAEAMFEGAKDVMTWSEEKDPLEAGRPGIIRAEGGTLRQLHAWLRERDPSFGGLVKVLNKRQEFMWVHPRFANEY